VSARAHRSTQRRYRLAPRSRSRRASRIDWDRAGRVALVLVLFLILVLYVNPISSFYDAWKEGNAAEESLAELEATNAELKQRVAGLNAPGGAEREARKMGMIAEGERAYVVRDLRDK
jgi:hypothetical protein